MPRLVLFNKPYDVLTQFTDRGAGRVTLADYLDIPGIYPAGRLDRDSEGLLVLSDHGPTIARIAQPRHKMAKTYYAQVEGVPTPRALQDLRRGVTLKDGPTLPAGADLVDDPPWLWPRDPPIRYRAAIPTAWLRLTITEGRNRQVRRMTAHVGFPTLRLIRWSVGEWRLGDLLPGQWRDADMKKPPSAPVAGKRRF